MLKKLSKQFTMHLGSDEVLIENEVKLDSFTAYPGLKEELDVSIAEEQSLAERHEVDMLKSVAARDQTKGIAAEFTIDLSKKMSGFAIVTDNKALLETVKFSPSRIRRFSDNKLLLVLSALLTSATENKLKVLEYGVTVPFITKGTDILAAFKTEMKNFVLSKAGQKQLTVQLKKQFAVTNSIFKRIDAIIETVGASDPVLHRIYFNARRIQSTGGIKLSMRGRVFDADTNLPLPKVYISIVSYISINSLSSNTEVLNNVMIAGAKGIFVAKSLPSGTYIFKVSYAGYADKEVTVYINEGIITRVEIPLTKLASDAGN